MHQHEQLKDKHYERIHFNCPHDGSDYKKQSLPPILSKFFKSASKLQQPQDRIHMALPKPSDSKLNLRFNASYNQFYKAYIYDVYNASRAAGYSLIKKRKFGEARFPGYEHKETTYNTSATVAKTAREYIFEKTDLDAEQILEQDKLSKNPPSLWVNNYNKNCKRDCLPEPKTDDDSSDYLTTDSEEEDDLTSKLNKLSIAPKPMMP